MLTSSGLAQHELVVVVYGSPKRVFPARSASQKNGGNDFHSLVRHDFYFIFIYSPHRLNIKLKLN